MIAMGNDSVPDVAARVEATPPALLVAGRGKRPGNAATRAEIEQMERGTASLQKGIRRTETSSGRKWSFTTESGTGRRGRAYRGGPAGWADRLPDVEHRLAARAQDRDHLGAEGPAVAAYRYGTDVAAMSP